MIRLKRIRTAPPVHENFFGLKRIKANLKLLQQKRDGELDVGGEKKWNSAFWKESKTQLLLESNDKCAYCETPTAVVSYGDVEHFRPKSKYWWLAYSYENYLPACAICNQKYKKDEFKLEDDTLRLKGMTIANNLTDAELEVIARTLTVDPIDDNEGRSLKDFFDELGTEKALLVNPYYDDPSIYFSYKPILENKHVVIAPINPKFEENIKACETFFGINRTELKGLRFQMYCLYMTYRHTLADPGISANTKLMNEARLTQLRSDKSAYAGMIRYFDTKNLDDLPWDFTILID